MQSTNEGGVIDDCVGRITDIIQKNFPSTTQNFATAKSLQDIGLDSLDVVDLAWTIETEFEIKFTDDELQSITSLESLSSLVGLKIKS